MSYFRHQRFRVQLESIYKKQPTEEDIDLPLRDNMGKFQTVEPLLRVDLLRKRLKVHDTYGLDHPANPYRDRY